jgi:dTDP-4-dehydrorhamnose 3,5-epimerase
LRLIETEVQGAYVVEIQPIEDARGFFARAWDAEEFAEAGLSCRISQINMAFNHSAGTIRGMHFQVEPHAEAKLIRCIAGAIFDVVADLRPDSPTFMKWAGRLLTSRNRLALYVPEGCAHGYLTMEDNSEVMYHVSQFYSPGSEGGVRCDDPALGIVWPRDVKVISDKDRSWPDYSPTASSSS